MGTGHMVASARFRNTEVTLGARLRDFVDFGCRGFFVFAEPIVAFHPSGVLAASLSTMPRDIVNRARFVSTIVTDEDGIVPAAGMKLTRIAAWVEAVAILTHGAEVGLRCRCVISVHK